MLAKTILAAQQLQELIAGVYEYNQRGPVLALVFFAEDGTTLPVAWVEVLADDVGLKVRTRPELSSEEIVTAMSAGFANGNR